MLGEWHERGLMWVMCTLEAYVDQDPWKNTLTVGPVKIMSPA